MIYNITILSTFIFGSLLSPLRATDIQENGTKTSCSLNARKLTSPRSEAETAYIAGEYEKAGQIYDLLLKESQDIEDFRRGAAIYFKLSAYDKSLDLYKKIPSSLQTPSDWVNILEIYQLLQSTKKKISGEYQEMVQFARKNFSSEVIELKLENPISQSVTSKVTFIEKPKTTKHITPQTGNLEWAFEEALPVLMTQKIKDQNKLFPATSKELGIVYQSALANTLKKLDSFTSNQENQTLIHYHMGNLHYYYALTLKDEDEKQAYIQEAEASFRKCPNLEGAQYFIKKIQGHSPDKK